MVLLIALPASLFAGVLAVPIMATLFQYGAFSVEDARMSGQSLVAFSVGLIAFMAIKILASGFYAQKNVRTPVRIAVLAMISNTVLNFILLHVFAHAGLALATSLSAWLNAGLLLWILHRDKVWSFGPHWKKFALQMFLANGMLLTAMLLLNPTNEIWLAWSWHERAWTMAKLFLLASTGYLGLAARRF